MSSFTSQAHLIIAAIIRQRLFLIANNKSRSTATYDMCKNIQQQVQGILSDRLMARFIIQYQQELLAIAPSSNHKNTNELRKLILQSSRLVPP